MHRFYCETPGEGCCLLVAQPHPDRMPVKTSSKMLICSAERTWIQEPYLVPREPARIQPLGAMLRHVSDPSTAPCRSLGD
jgi:hypothetical protein